MTLEILPVRTGGAAENMAIDFLLLQRYPPSPGLRRASPQGDQLADPVAGRQAGQLAELPRFRHYEWRGPAFTFGFSQKIASLITATTGLTRW
jgi:hypothetical protein